MNLSVNYCSTFLNIECNFLNLHHMKFIINESKLKKFLKNKFDFNPSDNITLITNYDELPIEFKGVIAKNVINSLLNQYGPIFLIRTNKNLYLYQDRFDKEVLADTNDYTVSTEKVLSELGLPPLGIPMKEIINLFWSE